MFQATPHAQIIYSRSPHPHTPVLRRSLRGSLTFPRRRLAISDQLGEIQGTPVRTGEGYGGSISMDGDYALISCGKAAYIFKTTDGWTSFSQVAELTGPSAGVYLHQSALSGNHAIIGAPDTNSGEGEAYVLTTNDGWATSTQITLTAPGSKRFGRSVSISGNAALIGAPFSGGTRNTAESESLGWKPGGVRCRGVGVFWKYEEYRRF